MKTCRLVVVLLVLVLLASAALNVYLYQRGRGFYLQLNEVRLDPLGLSYPVANAAPSATTSQTRVVLFGDSRIEDWPPPAGLEQFEFVNRGVSNQTTAQILARFDEQVAPLEPQVIVVQAGINDLKTIPLFPERKAEIVAGCQANIEQIVSKSRDLHATVILTTLFPLGEVPLNRRLFWSGDVAEGVEEVNAFVESLAAEDVLILDTGAILADEEGMIREEYGRDLLHLTAPGYEALNAELIRILEPSR